VRAERVLAAQCLARGEGDAAGITAGHVFKMKEHPRSDLNRRWFVISSAIDVAPNADAEAAGDPYVSVRVEAVDASVPYRPERVTPKPVIQGTQTAVVVAADKKVDKYGRVRVRFHWERAAKESPECITVRVAQSWAGKGWGAQFLPRVGQEVVVSFLDGDPDRPIVIGSVYNEEHLPPFALPDQAMRSGWRTASPNSSKDTFNELRFDDEADKEQIYLHAQKDLQVVVENDQTVTVGTSKKGNRTATIEGNDQLTVKGDGQETVNGNRNATVKGTDTIDVTKSLRLVSKEDITLECGAAKIVLKKDGSIEINGVDVKVKGSKGVSVDGTKTEVSGTDLDIKGTKTAVQGSATLDLTASGVASLKGSLTKIG
jgi:type VI secretion system secreted protein VgrG